MSASPLSSRQRLHGRPGAAIIVQTCAYKPNDKDVAARVAPRGIKLITRTAVHGRPGAAIMVQNSARGSDDKDIAGRAASHALQIDIARDGLPHSRLGRLW